MDNSCTSAIWRKSTSVPEIFHLLGLIFLAVIVFVWFAKPPFTPKVGGAAEAAGGH